MNALDERTENFSSHEMSTCEDGSCVVRELKEQSFLPLQSMSKTNPKQGRCEAVTLALSRGDVPPGISYLIAQPRDQATFSSPV